MTQNGSTDSDSSKPGKRPDNTSRFGLRWIYAAGGALFLALLLVSIFHPHLTERVKFFTENALSLSVLVIILFQAYIYRRQWDAMRGQLDAMKEQGRVMSAALAQNERAVKAGEAQAVASQASAQAARDSVDTTKEAFYIAERAYIRIQGVKSIRLVAGSSPQIEVWLFNGGKTPAWDISGRTSFTFARELVEDYDFENEPLTPTKGGSTLLAGDRRIIRWRLDDHVVSEAEFDAIQSGALKFMVIGEYRYKDFWGKEQVYSYRGLYDPGRNDLNHY